MWVMSGNVDKNQDGVNDDILFSIEDIVGGAFNDVIVGNEDENFLSGRGGNDRIYGHDGDDKDFWR